jgi:hypothetical protein
LRNRAFPNGIVGLPEKRFEGFPVSRHTPHSNEQLSHCGDDRHFARFVRSSQPFVILPQQALRRMSCRTTIQSDLRKRAYRLG